MVDEGRHLKQLEGENHRLKRIVADQANPQGLKICWERVGGGRSAAGLQRAQVNAAISERKACRYLGVARSTVQYRSRRPEQVELRDRLRQLAAERRRWGHRRLQVLLKREGWAAGRKRIHRLYVEEGLQVRRRRRKRVSQPRRPMTVPSDPNERWSLDLMSDTLASGRRFRCLTLLPPPRVHRHRYHGVLVPNTALRPLVTPTVPTARNSAPSGPRGSVRRARLLVRIYHARPLVRPTCGRPMRLIAFLTDPILIREVLDHLEVPTRPPRVRPLRGPPEASPEGVRPFLGSQISERGSRPGVPLPS